MLCSDLGGREASAPACLRTKKWVIVIVRTLYRIQPWVCRSGDVESGVGLGVVDQGLSELLKGVLSDRDLDNDGPMVLGKSLAHSKH